MKKRKKNKDSGENLHEAPESHLWVENLVMRPNDERKKEKRIRRSQGENLP